MRNFDTLFLILDIQLTLSGKTKRLTLLNFAVGRASLGSLRS